MIKIDRDLVKMFAAGLASTIIVAGSLLLLSTDGMVHRLSGIDLHFLVSTFVSFGLLTLLGTMAGLAQRRKMGPRILGFASRLGVIQRQAKIRWPKRAFPVAERLLTDLGWTALFVGLLGSIPDLPSAASGRPNGSELTSVRPYLEVFSPLSTWALIFIAPFVVARAVSVIRPEVGQAIKFPWLRLLILAGSYAALSENGAISKGFEVDGSGILPWLTLTLLLSYCGSVLSSLVRLAPTGKLRISAQAAFIVVQAFWLFALIGGLRALSSAASGLPMEEYGKTAESLGLHLENLSSLTKWAVILLIPFTAARAAGEIWPMVGKVLGFPIRRLVLLGITYAAFADNGVLSVLFGINTSQIFLVLTVALALSYMSSVLRNTSEVVAGKRFGTVARMTMEPMMAVVIAAVPSMVIWVALNHLPLINALLIDHGVTRDLGESYLPHFGAVYDLRYPVAALVFAIGLSLTLPNVLKVSEGINHKPMTAALGYSVVACLMWICGSSLSILGHGFALFGAIVASGIFTMALCELARYAGSSSNAALGDVGVWFSQSKVRGFVLGASFAFYGLLLRPVAYEVLWFAALYEYMVILVLLLMLLLVGANRARFGVAAPGGSLPVWTNWSHHQQVLEIKADPRSQSASSIYRRFVDEGEMRPLWKYLLGLLFRSWASLSHTISIGGTLRRGLASSPLLDILPITRSRKITMRKAALDEALINAKRALDASPEEMNPVEEDDLRNTASPFVENGSNREDVALTLVSAYWHKGADLDQALELWFPLMNLKDRTPRWMDSPGTRNRIKRWNQRRRRNLIEGAISHLAGRTTHESLSVATSAVEAPLFRTSNSLTDLDSPLGILNVGEGMEFIREDEAAYFVRSSSGVEGFVSKEAILREPILPNDKWESAI